jgi:hypothetical protein
VTTSDLRDYIVQHLPVFASPEIVPAGVGYHYSQYAAEIQQKGRMLGAPINAQLAATQRGIRSTPASDPSGVVFAYPSLAIACRMAPDCAIAGLGLRCDVFRLHFRGAVSAEQINDSAVECRERQLLIIAGQISRYEWLGHARDLVVIDG